MSNIRSKPQTAEFDAGYERVFGNRKPQRGRWRFDEKLGKLVPYDGGAPLEPRVHVLTDAKYDGLRATDGTDIGTRQKWNEYARANGLTHMDDFKSVWAKAQAERDAISTAEHDVASRTEEIKRAMYEVFDSPGIQERPRRESGEEFPVIREFVLGR